MLIVFYLGRAHILYPSFLIFAMDVSEHEVRAQKVMDTVRKAHSDGKECYGIPFGCFTPNVVALGVIADAYIRKHAVDFIMHESSPAGYVGITWK